MITTKSSPISSLVPGCNPPKAQTLVLAKIWLTGTSAVLCQASAHGNPKDHYQISHRRPHSGVVYKKAHKAMRRKVDHPFARIWDVDDLSSGVESDSEGPPMNNRSPRDSPSTVDGLPREWKLFLSILLPHLHIYFL